jgi:hypothetical protein
MISYKHRELPRIRKSNGKKVENDRINHYNKINRNNIVFLRKSDERAQTRCVILLVTQADVKKLRRTLWN